MSNCEKVNEKKFIWVIVHENIPCVDITYCTNNRSVQCRGELIVTKYRLLFVKNPPDPIQVCR